MGLFVEPNGLVDDNNTLHRARVEVRADLAHYLDDLLAEILRGQVGDRLQFGPPPVLVLVLLPILPEFAAHLDGEFRPPAQADRLAEVTGHGLAQAQQKTQRDDGDVDREGDTNPQDDPSPFEATSLANGASAMCFISAIAHRRL